MHFRRSLLVVPAVVLAIAALLAVPNSRVPILRAMGNVLIGDESPVDRVDVVVVSIDAGVAGLLEAADLVHGGAASCVATFASPPGKVDLALHARGVPIEEKAASFRRQLLALGVASIVPIPQVQGTKDQGRVLPIWCKQHGWDSVIVVTSWHHSRRVQRELERAMKDSSADLYLRISRHSDFDPDNWWQDRDGVRTVLVEIQKLVIDLVRHPFS